MNLISTLKFEFNFLLQPRVPDTPRHWMQLLDPEYDVNFKFARSMTRRRYSRIPTVFQTLGSRKSRKILSPAWSFENELLLFKILFCDPLNHGSFFICKDQRNRNARSFTVCFRDKTLFLYWKAIILCYRNPLSPTIMPTFH